MSEPVSAWRMERGRIEDEAHGDGGFDLALTHEIAVGTGVEFPVDVPWFIAGLVGAVLGELARHARLAAGVQSRQQAGYEMPRSERQPARGGEEFGVENGRHDQVRTLLSS